MAPRVAIWPGTNELRRRLFAITRNRTCDTIWTEKGKEGRERVRCSRLTTTHNTFGPDAPITDDGRRSKRASFTPMFSPKTLRANK